MFSAKIIFCPAIILIDLFDNLLAVSLVIWFVVNHDDNPRELFDLLASQRSFLRHVSFDGVLNAINFYAVRAVFNTFLHFFGSFPRFSWCDQFAVFCQSGSIFHSTEHYYTKKIFLYYDATSFIIISSDLGLDLGLFDRPHLELEVAVGLESL